MTNSFELHIDNDFSHLRSMSDWLHAVTEQLALSEAKAKDLDLCANEAVTNIILYAFEDQKKYQIYLRIELKNNQDVCLKIQDDGKPFNPFETQITETYDTIGNINIGGLGIKLIRNLADQYYYRWLNGKNIITLCFSSYQTFDSLVCKEY